MAFALTSWNKVLELTDGLFEQAELLESKIVNFLQAAEAISSVGAATDVHDYTEVDREFSKLLANTKDGVRDAFANNFDIPQALKLISELITSANSNKPNNGLIVSTAQFVKYIMQVLGFANETLKLTEASSANLGGIAQSLAQHRQEVRTPARALLSDVKAISQLLGVNLKGQRPEDEEGQKRYDAVKMLDEHAKSILSIMDKQRDTSLPQFGIRLEDGPNNTVTFKLGDPEDVDAKQKKQAAQKYAEEQKKKQQQNNSNKKPAAEVVDPATFFKSQTDKYSEWDETGFPTKDVKGEPLTRGQINKLKKVQKVMQDKYNKAHSK